MNNPLKERNHGIPTYMQNVYDKRYLSYVSVIPQLFYNFWDRIGDLLYCYFETGLKERDVFINRILDNIPEKYKQSDNYKNLLEIYATYIKPLLDQRKEIVHYQMVETATYWATFLEDEEKIQEFQERKEKFPDVYNECLKMSFEGFGCALKLIDELANK